MTIVTSAARPTPRAARFRGLELQVGDGTGLLPALPLWIRRHDECWEPVGHAIDRPAQIGGLGVAPWSHVTGVRLTDEGDVVRLTGIAEPGTRRFTLTATDPLGAWSELHWLGAGGRSAPRRRADRTTTDEPGLISWHDFGSGPLDDRWIGREWPGAAWRLDEDGLLRPCGRGERGTARFIGREVRHRELAVATRVHVPTTGGAEGGLELHIDGEPRRVGVGRAPDGTVLIVGSAGTVGALPASTTEVDLALIARTGSFGLEAASDDGPVTRRTVHRSAAPLTAAGMYAAGIGAPVGFAWFEYRGGRSAVTNRTGGRR